MKLILLAISAVLAAEAQTGVTPEWDVRSNMQTLAGDVRKLQPIIEKINPADWIAKGASETYVKQLASAQSSLQHLVIATDKLSREPERLTVAIDAFFRMEKMDVLLNSLKEGIWKYQSPALADDLARLMGANHTHRERLQRHIQDLALTREQELRTIDEEAQRCRADLLRQSAPRKRGSQ